MRLRTVAMVAALGAAACSKSNEEAARAAREAKQRQSEMPPDPREHGAAGDDGSGAAMGDNPHGGGSPHGSGGETLEALPGGKVGLGPLALAVPPSWKAQPAGGMRAATWQVPGMAAGDEAELAVFFFGAQGAGGIEDNLDRWLGQFQGEGGRPAKDSAKISKRQVAGQEATLVEVRGRYVTSMPGTGERIDRPDQVMRGAIVPTAQGPYYFKLVGPARTVDAAGKDWDAFVAAIAAR